MANPYTLSKVTAAYTEADKNERREDYHNTKITVMGYSFHIYSTGDMYQINGRTFYRSATPVYKAIYLMLNNR